MSKRGTAVTKQKWTEEEETALRAGVAKYDVGKWRHIQKDEVLGPILKNRSNVDLKDKWRNLNMDSGGSRRDSRGASGDRSAGRRKRKKRPDKGSAELGDDDDTDYVGGRSQAADRRKRRRMSKPSYEDDPDAYPEPARQSVPVSEEMILAALIQRQDPSGSDAETICQWIEDNYNTGTPLKRNVKWILKQMMEAGRISGSNGMYTLSGIPRQLAEDAARWPPDEDGSLNGTSSRTAREAAEAAARAVQEAEEAAELATELIAAADRFDRETPTNEAEHETTASPEED